MLVGLSEGIEYLACLRLRSSVGVATLVEGVAMIDEEEAVGQSSLSPSDVT